MVQFVIIGEAFPSIKKQPPSPEVEFDLTIQFKKFGEEYQSYIKKTKMFIPFIV